MVPPLPSPSTQTSRAFTLLEVLVATTVMVMLIGVLAGITNTVANVLGQSKASTESLQSAQEGFDTLRRTLASATLNSYWGYDSPTAPKEYIRQSELHFVSGSAASLTGVSDARTHGVFFQAPLGFADPAATIQGGAGTAQTLQSALNAVGFYLQFGPDPGQVPGLIGGRYQPRYRFRLMQYMEPTTDLSVYKYTAASSAAERYKWFRDQVAQEKFVSVLAENVVALVILPCPASAAPTELFTLAASVQESWDSTGAYGYDTWEGTLTTPTLNYLPPVVRVLMVVIDEASATRLQGNSTSMPFDLDALGLFRAGGSEASLRDDLAKLESILNATPGNLAGNKVRCNYRVFETDIPLAESE